MRKGETLSPVEKYIDQKQIERYAAASGDYNPIHIDHDYAVATQFRGTIAHGMMIAATISEMMTASFGRSWPETGTMKIRFRAPVKPGQRVTANGTVTKVSESPDGIRVTCSVSVLTDEGETAISGRAELVLEPE